MRKGIPSAGTRLAYLDNLKVALIAGIIAAHAFNSYSDGPWTRDRVERLRTA